ncbi:MAG TPA: adenosine deaminase [Candidatus Limnocylindrales bacterium]|nr:adenosine deaminase [Candidatus Limnocylindrales bacterium]
MTALDQRTLRALVRAMPKAELHLHLDGSLRVDTALDIARTRDIEAPGTFGAMRSVLVAPDQVTDQAELLAAFDLPILLMQDAEALERIAADLVEDKAHDNVRYAEVRWAPLLHTNQGLTGRQVVDAVWKGSVAAARKAETEVRLIATLMRSHAPERNLAFVRSLEKHGVPDGLVAVDLAGPEARFPDPELHREAIELARSMGLHVTVHAGEWGGGAQVLRSLSVAPERIAHGPHAIEDPACVAALVERGVVLDLCPTSNTQANIVPTYEAFPLKRLMQAGVRVTLNTDDLTVSDVSLSQEYERAVTQIGLTVPELWSLNLAAVDVAFCDEATKERLREAFLAWGAGIPELLAG